MIELSFETLVNLSYDLEKIDNLDINKKYNLDINQLENTVSKYIDTHYITTKIYNVYPIIITTTIIMNYLCLMFFCRAQD